MNYTSRLEKHYWSPHDKLTFAVLTVTEIVLLPICASKDVVPEEIEEQDTSGV